MTEKTKKENAIVAANTQFTGRGLALHTLDEMKLVAETFMASHLVPSHFSEPAKIIVAFQVGAELGFTPWQSLQNLHVVNGNVGIKSSAIGGLIRNSGKLKTMTQTYAGTEGEPEYKAVVVSVRKDDKAEHRTEFSVADARTAGLYDKKGPWQQYPKDMLMWRALSRHGRMFYGDVLSGFYTDEELRAIQAPPAAPTPQVPAREERKQVDAVVSDSNAVLALKIKEVFDDFRDALESPFCLGPKLDGVPEEVLWHAFARLAMFVIPKEDNDTDFSKPENYTLDLLKSIQVRIISEGVPETVSQLIPLPITTAEAEANLEEKLAEYKYKCNACAEVFDEPGGSGKTPLCPKCLCSNVVSTQDIAESVEVEAQE